MRRSAIAQPNVGRTIFACPKVVTLCGCDMARVRVTRDDFLEEPQGKTFTDVLNDSEQPFDCVIDFFDDAGLIITPAIAGIASKVTRVVTPRFLPLRPEVS
jgi:hypothetical protein